MRWRLGCPLAVMGLAVLSLTACEGERAEPHTARPPGTGIEGFVTLGPTCAVVTLSNPCPDRPYAATVSVRDGAGNEVTRFQTGEAGRFRVELPPGTHTLVPIEPRPGLPPRGQAQTVTVADGRMTPVLVKYDSGIR